VGNHRGWPRGPLPSRQQNGREIPALFFSTVREGGRSPNSQTVVRLYSEITSQSLTGPRAPQDHFFFCLSAKQIRSPSFLWLSVFLPHQSSACHEIPTNHPPRNALVSNSNTLLISIIDRSLNSKRDGQRRQSSLSTFSTTAPHSLQQCLFYRSSRHHLPHFLLLLLHSTPPPLRTSNTSIATLPPFGNRSLPGAGSIQRVTLNRYELGKEGTTN